MAEQERISRPDFLVIGAMKCATTTLHEQLARQPGVFMTRPKEPNYFSDDAEYARGPAWYASLFRDAPPGSVRGESSTHYTKRPTHPDTVGRIAETMPGLKFIYVMRHPVDRLVSQYVHERTVGLDVGGIEDAVGRVAGLVNYGLYATQLEPYAEAFGLASILPVFFPRLTRHPQAELGRIGRFLGLPTVPVWDEALGPQNVSTRRLRRSPIREALVTAPVLTPIRRRLIPRGLSEPLKAFWRSKESRPDLPFDLERSLTARFDDDLALLGRRLGVRGRLCCDNFDEVTASGPLEWAGPG